jgi:glycosyltransferase involved in cell wall biosynthesis
MNYSVEVRVPTYRRPVLLRRALASLVAQTYPLWRAIVIDDDPTSDEARGACEEFKDNRIMYQKNEINLGVGANIDRAFSQSFLPGTTHACVLEDDNYYLPNCLRSNLEIMEQNEVDVVLRNQLIEAPDSTFTTSVVGPRTTYDGQYVDGVVCRDELWGSFFYSTAANNSSLFWRVGVGLNFSTLAMAGDPVFQERLRTLCIDRSVYIAMTAQIVWRDNGAESTRPKFRGLGWRLSQIRATTRERKLYLMLYTHLRKHNLEAHIWQSRLRKIDAGTERVFWRVGIQPPITTNLAAKDRVNLIIKRELAKMASLVVVESIKFALGKDRIVSRKHESPFIEAAYLMLRKQDRHQGA